MNAFQLPVDLQIQIFRKLSLRSLVSLYSVSSGVKAYVNRYSHHFKQSFQVKLSVVHCGEAGVQVILKRGKETCRILVTKDAPMAEYQRLFSYLLLNKLNVQNIRLEPGCYSSRSDLCRAQGALCRLKVSCDHLTTFYEVKNSLQTLKPKRIQFNNSDWEQEAAGLEKVDEILFTRLDSSSLNFVLVVIAPRVRSAIFNTVVEPLAFGNVDNIVHNVKLMIRSKKSQEVFLRFSSWRYDDWNAQLLLDPLGRQHAFFDDVPLFDGCIAFIPADKKKFLVLTNYTIMDMVITYQVLDSWQEFLAFFGRTFAFVHRHPAPTEANLLKDKRYRKMRMLFTQ